jgi:NADPH:quinone reductase-like Zn-dependent oxidoreductase
LSRIRSAPIKAIGFHRFGGPGVLEELQLADPVAQAGQVRVKVHTFGVNQSDIRIRSGQVKTLFGQLGADYPSPPYVPGWEFYGEVDQVGPGVTTGAIGDAVVGLPLDVNGSVGGYGELVVTDSNSVVAAPRNVSAAAAGSFLMSALTAYGALETLALPSGATIAITGAAGTVGGFAIQLAKHYGLTVVADAQPSDMGRVRSAGADVIVERGSALSEQIRAHFPDGVDAVIDNALLHDQLVPAVRDGGVIATLLMYSAESARDIRWLPVKVTDHITDRMALENLRDLLEMGVLTTGVAFAQSATVNNAIEAHRMLARGGIRGRLVLDRRRLNA